VYTRTHKYLHTGHKELHSTFKYSRGGAGTVILVKDVYKLSDILYMPSGRGINAIFNGVEIVNIHAPSGAGRRREREEF
jgi:hypothetical protein